MAGGLLTTLRYGSATLGLVSLLSPYVTRYWKFGPGLLRPLLNVSWGYLFGSHVWEVFANTLKDSNDDQSVSEGGAKREVTTSDLFYLLAVLGNSFVLFTTFALAPSFKRLQFCAYVSIFSTLVNYFLVVPYVSKKKTECLVFKAVEPKTLSRFLLFTTLFSLTLYTAS